MKTNYYYGTLALMLRKLLTSDKIFTSRKTYFAVLFFMLVQTILATAQIGENDPTFNTYDNIPAHGANGVVSNLIVQPNDKIIIAGNFSLYNGMTANKLARLNSNGKIDPTFFAGDLVDVYVGGHINSMSLQADNKIVIAGNRLARINPNGTRDDFPSYMTDGEIIKTIIQPDQKILAAGTFTTYGPLAVKRIIRLNSDGNTDNTFDAIISDTLVTIEQIALQPDGKIIVMGAADFVGANPMDSYLWAIRLNADGSRDYSFSIEIIDVGGDSVSPQNVSIEIENTDNILIAYGIRNNNLGVITLHYGKLLRLNPTGTILNDLETIYVNAMILQADGKIILAGAKNLGISNYVKKQVIRLNTDLTADALFSFVDNHRYNGISDANILIADFQSDGKIVLGGDFSEFNGLIENNVARINNDGSFNHSFNRRSGCDGGIFASAMQTNGKTIIGGEFSRYNFDAAPNIARLRTNGRLDHTFDAGSGTNGKIYTIALTTNHKYIIGGDFTSYDGHACNNIVRLYGDGSIDLGFTAQADDIVRKITIADDGKIIIGGNFDNVNGVSRIAIARLLANGALDLTFSSPITDTLAETSDCKISPLGKIYAAVNYRSDDYLLPDFIDRGILCLNNNGSIDPTFNIPSNTFYEINTLAFNNDGKILAGGQRTYLSSGIIAQLNSDGTIDPAFDYAGLENYLDRSVRTIDVLNNDKIIIGGDFANHIRLLNENGNVNSHLFQYADDNIYTTILTDDYQMIIAGIFNEYSYDVRNSIARIDLNEPELKSLKPTEQSIASNPDLILNVYPNPASSEISAINLIPGSVLKVYNSIGKEVYSEILTDTKSTIALSEYSNGIYFMTTETNGVRINTKFIVSK